MIITIFVSKTSHIRFTNMGIPGDIGIPATENLRLYLSQATLPLMKIPRNAPRLPPSGHRSHNIGLTTRPERFRRLEFIRPLRIDVKSVVSECMCSQPSPPNASALTQRNEIRLKKCPRPTLRWRRSRFGDRKCNPYSLQSDL